MKKRYICFSVKWLFLSIFLTILDISTKCWIKTQFLVGDCLNICPGINFCYITNSGLACGLFNGVLIDYCWLVNSIAILLIIIIFGALYKSVKSYSNYDSISYTVIIGGAMGNVYDRILYGTVTDFIDLYIKNWHWPAFNLADVEVCCGIVLLLMKRLHC